MHHSTMRLLLLVCCLFLFIVNFAGAQDRRSLPEGNSGIAASRPGDRNIREHPEVVFAEGFEDDTIESVFDRWETVQNGERMTLANREPPGRAGGSSLLIEHTGGEGVNSIGLYRRLTNQRGEYDGFETLFFRMYVLFSEDCHSIHHLGTHLGGYHPTTSYPQGGAGERPEGDDRFTVHPEPRGKTGEPWTWAWYNYWCEMRGSPPNGKPWGNSFMAPDQRPEVTRGNWQCVEVMIKLNDVGTRNGELALWVDGELVSHVGPGFPVGTWIWGSFIPGREGPGITWDDGRKEIPGNQPFQGFRWRTDPALTISHVWAYVYMTDVPDGYTSRIWFDQLVVAREYIGPIASR